jgi:hypothetical protein
MNLTAMLKEGSLQDHSWLVEGLVRPEEKTFDPVAHGIKKRNNIKGDLEIEWGYGGMAPVFFEDPSAGQVKRHIPTEDLGDVEEVIRFARDMMNRGFPRSQIVAAMRERFTLKTMVASMAGIKSQFSLDGIVGRIAIDGRGYKNCKQALDAASRSPYKRFIKYVIGCNCGDPHMIEMPPSDSLKVASGLTGNSVDDFLGFPDIPVVATRPHCRSTMLPIVSGMGDLDESEMNNTLIDIRDLTNAPAMAMEEGGSKLKAVRDAFLAIDRMADKKASDRYAGVVSASEFVLKKADNEIEFGASPLPDIEVNPVNEALQQTVEPVAMRPTNFDGPNSLKSDLGEVDLAGQPDLSPIGVELADDRKGGIVIDDARECGGQEVNPAAGEIEVSLSGRDDLDIDMTAVAGGIFTGSDEIIFDEEKTAIPELAVDMRQDMVVDLKKNKV